MGSAWFVSLRCTAARPLSATHDHCATLVTPFLSPTLPYRAYLRLRDPVPWPSWLRPRRRSSGYPELYTSDIERHTLENPARAAQAWRPRKAPFAVRLHLRAQRASKKYVSTASLLRDHALSRFSPRREFGRFPRVSGPGSATAALSRLQSPPRAGAFVKASSRHVGNLDRYTGAAASRAMTWASGHAAWPRLRWKERTRVYPIGGAVSVLFYRPDQRGPGGSRAAKIASSAVIAR